MQIILKAAFTPLVPCLLIQALLLSSCGPVDNPKPTLEITTAPERTLKFRNRLGGGPKFQAVPQRR